MQLSVIIVNYNVKHFLEQCLHSVQKAMTGINGEVIVVDNNSSDDSIDYLEPIFSTIRFVRNTENKGFSKACNQGLRLASGEYILFLNPDTIIPEDCFHKCISFFQAHGDAGAIGIKMLDGSGKFLNESKRSFPNPLTSLYKLFGFSKLFPESPVFSKYHLGHLDENESNEVDVLAGAFMMIRKKVLDEVGSFDEIFFMYGEDVDLSYRIQKAGYKNFYFAGSSIIHFKGESTRRGSMNYVRMFYKAMSDFVRKHYGGSKAGLYIFLINLAIWLRAGLTAIANFIRRIGLPLLDAGILLLSFWLMKTIWTGYVRKEVLYENELLWIAFPAYTIFFLVTAYYAGLYDRSYRRFGLAGSVMLATVFLLAAYSLLPEQFRFSRGIILFGALFGFVLMSILRWILVKTHVLSFSREKEEKANTLIAGSPQEYDRVMQILNEAGLQERVLGRIAVIENDTSALGSKRQMKTIFTSVPFREIIFCEGVLSFSEIIDIIKKLPEGIISKIHAAESGSIVGSKQKDTSGEALSKQNGFNISNPYYRRLKRLIDVAGAITGIVGFPVHLFFVKKPFKFLTNCFSVLFAKRSWVGYTRAEQKLPDIRSAIIGCNGIPVSVDLKLPDESLQTLDYWYARDYKPAADLKLILKTYRYLGN